MDPEIAAEFASSPPLFLSLSLPSFFLRQTRHSRRVTDSPRVANSPRLEAGTETIPGVLTKFGTNESRLATSKCPSFRSWGGTVNGPSQPSEVCLRNLWNPNKKQQQLMKAPAQKRAGTDKSYPTVPSTLRPVQASLTSGARRPSVFSPLPSYAPCFWPGCLACSRPSMQYT